MQFYDKKIKVDRPVKKEIRELLKTFDVKVKFGHYAYSSVSIRNNRISLSTNKNHHLTLQTVWSSVFHELSHILCFREGLYERYHNWDENDRQSVIYVRRYGLRAERFVDKKAKALMKIHLPDIPFWSGYQEERAKAWYDKWLDKNFPLEQ